MTDTAHPGPPAAPGLAAIRAAADRISRVAVRTPLVRIRSTGPDTALYLKLESLQPIGSFKIRGAANAMLSASPADLSRGVFTASAGNMAQGVAWTAAELGVESTSIVPDHAPEAKLAAIRGYGGRVVPVPFDEWWDVVRSRSFPGQQGLFVHPFADTAVMAGNGTIGLEIVEDIPDVDTVIVPFGGGGLGCGIASAVKALRPATRVIASEVATSAAFAAALEAGGPTTIAYNPTFVDGIGSTRVSDEMWPLVDALLDGSIVSSIEEVADAVRDIAGLAHVVAEGAGASALAAARSGRAGAGNIVCVVSGGNIDLPVLGAILAASASSSPRKERP